MHCLRHRRKGCLHDESVYKRSCIDFVNQSGINAEIKFENSEASEAAFLKYLQSPAEEDI